MNVTALALVPAARPVERSWEEMLLGAVRPEFQVAVYRPAPGDPILHGPMCAVGGCPGRGVNRSLGMNAGGANRSAGTRFRGYVCLPHVEMWRLPVLVAGDRQRPLGGSVQLDGLARRDGEQPAMRVLEGWLVAKELHPRERADVLHVLRAGLDARGDR